jgi:hypothetical protein
MTRLSGTALFSLFLSGLSPHPARSADACDILAARIIHDTGASLAGRAGHVAVFRAQAAERMSLDCRAPARMTVASLAREPSPTYFALVGLASHALAGADADAAEGLALNLHQDSLLARAPRRGVTGRAAMLCETGPRTDALQGERTVCRIAARSGLSRIRRKG